jgi:hypothetical protein
VSLIELYKPDWQGTPAPSLPTEVEGEEKYEVEAILDSRYVDGIMSYYVK